MTSTISNTDNTIDSSDIIARIEDLNDERNSLQWDVDNSTGDELHNANVALNEWCNENNTELSILENVAAECEGYGDWLYGETLINENYFTQYIEELIGDCYEMPKAFNSGEWPWRHMSIDFEAAADEAKADYMDVDFDGVVFLMRA